MQWGSGIGSVIGALLAGPPGAFTGHFVGGLAGKMVEQQFDKLSPLVVGAVELTVGEAAGERLREIGKRLIERQSPEALESVGDALQMAFRDAFIAAIHDVGGPRCFPGAQSGYAYLDTAPGQYLMRSQRVLADQIPELPKAIATAAQAGNLTPNAAPGAVEAADVYLHLRDETAASLTAAFYLQIVTPYLQRAGGALFAELHSLGHDFEGYLRRVLLDRLLVHLGELVRSRAAAWRAFNELILAGYA
jgi:hypothetical protein